MPYCNLKVASRKLTATLKTHKYNKMKLKALAITKNKLKSKN